jgi:hypothetical protein
MTTTRPAPFTTGQRVEVLRTDFKAPGMPTYWAPATVTQVERKGTLYDLTFRFDDPALPVSREMVGPRGGGKRVRAL